VPGQEWSTIWGTRLWRTISVPNPGLEVRSCGDAILLIPSTNAPQS
jgi:hypothetical protein